MKLTGFSLTHRSYLGSKDKIELSANGQVNQVYGPKYAPATDSPLEHLAFSLKYDDLNLPFLKAVFETIPAGDLVSYIASSPAGKYARKIGFLYEFLTAKPLPVDSTITGNYTDLLEGEKYVTGRVVKNPRWRINDNLLGTSAFCPIVRRTNVLNELLQVNIPDQIRQLKQQYSPDIFRRATITCTARKRAPPMRSSKKSHLSTGWKGLWPCWPKPVAETVRKCSAKKA